MKQLVLIVLGVAVCTPYYLDLIMTQSGPRLGFCTCVVWSCMYTHTNIRAPTSSHPQSSWFDPNGVSPALVNAYRLPQLVKGWEAGMLRFLYARMSILSPVMRGLAPSAAEGDDSQLGRFAATVAAAGIPVLLIHGADDALVPLRNSQALESLVPGAQLVVLPRCGHTPQEEMPQRVSDEVDAFLRARGVVGSSRV